MRHGRCSRGPSSFQRSCSNIRLKWDDDGAWITTNCRDRGGRNRRASIDLPGIENNDGRLMHSRRRARSSFQRSCRDQHLNIDPNWVELLAVCRDRRGREHDAGIPVDNIANIDGTQRRQR
ncbi:CVNH domain-containing protein [Breoghania sp. L-A4]|uniref:mannose-binding lectin n=1 Tax=Breoghania sp. L-A4 TaxID=2304600 RepID=UPI000E35C122|nr:CVNH domain-containing protein [Breoghania sp. L-A4]AXS42315.1 hypothetical protein D1F64_22910 [Breoghania sp. L-A4]